MDIGHTEADDVLFDKRIDTFTDDGHAKADGGRRGGGAQTGGHRAQGVDRQAQREGTGSQSSPSLQGASGDQRIDR